MKFNIKIEERAIIGSILGLTPEEIMEDICKNVKTKVSPQYIYIVSRLPYSYISSVGIDNDKAIYEYGKSLGLEEHLIYYRIEEVRNKMFNEYYRDKMNNIIHAAYIEKKEMETRKPDLQDNSGLVH